MEMLLQHLHNLPAAAKRAILVMLDVAIITFSLWLSLSLRYGEFYTNFQQSMLIFVCLPLLSVPVFVRVGMYRAVLRYVGTRALQQIAKGIFISSLMLLIMVLIIRSGLPRSWFVLYGALAFLMIGGTRMILRQLMDTVHSEREGVPVAIYGAGAAGRQLVNMLRLGREYRPMVFLDDDGQLQGREVDGLPVVDPQQALLSDRLSAFGVEQIFMAIPATSRSVRKQILSRLERLPFHVRSVPGIDDILSGVSIDKLQEIRIEDLLGRDPVPPDPTLMGQCIRGRVVMVTGAGGSIGSELCRQIVNESPEKLLLLERSEYALYAIDRELRDLVQRENLGTDVVALLGDVCDSPYVEAVLKSYRAETVFHAAAYKHVPIVEHNIIEGVRNNVVGTWAAATAAAAAGVATFVCISTDKAVRPTNVMGASKRFAELVLQGMAQDISTTRFCIVRFGNVLGSSGSVVPLFRRQIAAGGPVTVTHPDITRYFMTIPEAAQLVIQAGALSKGGDVFVLNMGEPVKIIDLAVSMVRLAGLDLKDKASPDGDIEIQYTGLRPGEKLYEELMIGDRVLATQHPKIMYADEESMSRSLIESRLQALSDALGRHSCTEVLDILLQTVHGYQPTGQIKDMLWHQAARAETAPVHFEPRDGVLPATGRAVQ